MKGVAKRIPIQVMTTAISKVRSMTFEQKERLGDEIYRAQPNMMGAVLVMHRMGVSYEKIEFLIDILWVCYQAMKESGLVWPEITIDEQDRQMTIYVATINFGEGLSAPLQERVMQQYIDAHPEQYLLAYVYNETTEWMRRIVPEESDKHVMLTAVTLVNCIAFVTLPNKTKITAKKKKPR